MANVNIKMPDELLSKLSKLGKEQDDISARVLEAGAEVMEEKLKSAVSSAVGKDTKYESRSTGELVGAVGTSPVKIDRNGNSNIKVGFAEPHSEGVSNAMLASLIEYGKTGQPPKPFMKRAKSAAKTPVKQAMIAKFEEEINKL